MGIKGSYVADFIFSVWGALTFAALSFIDVVAALRDINVNVPVLWVITPDERRLIFLALAFLWMFVWYVRVRSKYDNAKLPAPDMPLHEAARYLARDSGWAARYPCKLDDDWITRVNQELMSKLNMKHVYAFGIYKADGKASESGAKEIPFEFFPHAKWYSCHLCTDDPPSHMWRDSEHGGGVFRRVKLNKGQVEKAWPRRSAWQRFRRKSPVERINYDEIFRNQDESYQRLENGDSHLNVFDEMFEKGSQLGK